MEPITLDFAIGVSIGVLAQLLFLRRSLRKDRLQKPARRMRPVNNLRSVPRPTKTLRVSRGTSAGPRTKPKDQLATESNPAQSPVPYTEPPQSSCPTCGLLAPEKLMAEHLLGSPLHRKQAVAPVTPRILPSTTSARMTVTLEEDSRESMRSLLQMLVPPRAFGRRHVQRTVNPLGQLVQTLD